MGSKDTQKPKNRMDGSVWEFYGKYGTTIEDFRVTAKGKGF